jgi:hydroxyacylglutathione hydrolase
LAIHSYVIGDESSGEAAVVDPTRDVEEYIRYAEENRLTIRHILETHVHADFVSGSLELKSRLNGEPQIHCSGSTSIRRAAGMSSSIAPRTYTTRHGTRA